MSHISLTRILAASNIGKDGEVKFAIKVIGPGLWQKRTPDGKRIYAAAHVLKAALPLFDNRPVYGFEAEPTLLDHLPDDLQEELRQVSSLLWRNVIGFIKNPKWGKDDKGDEAVLADLHIHQPEIARTLRAAFTHGLKEFAGVSIVGDGDYETTTVEGQIVASITAIHSIETIDLVSHPAADGRLLKLAASKSKGDAKMKTHLAKLLRMAAVLKDASVMEKLAGLQPDAVGLKASLDSISAATGEDVDKIKAKLQEAQAALQGGDLEKLMSLIDEALSLLTPAASGEPSVTASQTAKNDQQQQNANGAQQNANQQQAGAQQVTASNQAVTDAAAQVAQDRAAVESIMGEAQIDKIVNESALPDGAKQKVAASLKASRTFKTDDIKKQITAEGEYLSQMMGGMAASGQYYGRISASDNSQEQKFLGVVGMLTGKPMKDSQGKLVQPFRGLKHMMRVLDPVRFMNDDNFHPKHIALALSASPYDSELRPRELDGSGRIRLQASMTTADIPTMFGDAMHRAMLETNPYVERYANWRKLVRMKPLADYRAHDFEREGYFNEFEQLTDEDSTLQEIAALSAEKVPMTLKRFGGWVGVTEAMIFNDDLDLIQRIPTKLIVAAEKGMWNGVWKSMFVTSNVTGYDSLAFIHAVTHLNGAASSGAALTPATAQAGRLAMFNQTAFGGTDPLGSLNQPKFILHGAQLEDMTNAICKAKNRNVVSTGQGNVPANAPSDADSTAPNLFAGVEPFLIPELQNHNNGRDWIELADPAVMPCIAVGFLKGQEQPDIATEAKNSGADFEQNVMRIKAVHRRTIDIVDHRGGYGQLGVS